MRYALDTEGQEFGKVDSGIFVGDNPSFHLIFDINTTTLGDHSTVGNATKQTNDSLNLNARNVLPAPTDTVFRSIDKVEIALRVLPEKVASMEPSVAPSLSCCRGIIDVFSRNEPGDIAADKRLADLADRHLDIIFIG